MKKQWRYSVILILLLAACTPQPAEPTAQATRELIATDPAVTATAIASKPADANNPAPQGDTITLTIVPEESSVSYEVAETFLNENNRLNVAVGKTSTINGEIFANPADPTQSKLGAFSVDISAFKSDSNRRDSTIRSRFLESAKYPIATFVPRSISGLPESYTAGQPYTFQVLGDLTVKQTTSAVTFDVTAQYDGNTLTGNAQTTILMSDFGVGPISIAGILNTENEVKINFDFVARP